MNQDLALYLSKQVLWQAITISSPVIITALVCGLILSILQASTQIQDSSLSVTPKILASLIMLMICGGWMLHQLTDFAQHIFSSIPEALG